MYCPNCGNKIDDSARFCPHCGADLSGRSQSGMNNNQNRQNPFNNETAGGPQNGYTSQNGQYGPSGYNGQPYGQPPYGQSPYEQPYWGSNWSTYPDVKHRNIALCIVFSIITCGIYGIYWFVCLANDVNTVSGHFDDTSGGIVFLYSLITLGIYSWYWAYKAGQKLDETAYNHGRLTNSRSTLYLILSIFGLGIVAWALMQSDLNEYAGYY